MQEISVSKARELLAVNPMCILLDVRSQEEYEQIHLPQSIHISIHEKDFPQRIQKLAREDTYLVFCKSGGRSRAACEFMEKVGFRKVYNIAGWIFE